MIELVPLHCTMLLLRFVALFKGFGISGFTVRYTAPMSLADRSNAVFTPLFRYHFARRPARGVRKTSFGKYERVLFRNASESPLALLLGERLICEPTAVEILLKKGADQHIDDTDLESVIISVREEPDTLFVLVYAGGVPSDDYVRLFRAFARRQVVILPLGEKELARLEKWIGKSNFNACLVYLTILADKVTSEEERLPERYKYQMERQQEANRTRLERMGKLRSPQLRTLVKKLSFLLSFEKSGSEVSEACRSAKISRKTFYLWCENDPIFKKLLDV
jgi:hypothetical protein